tara:strand:- start:4617 stop:4799 length:183 start_codon:yes stop_codon:yes gene_type:complete
MTLTEEEIQKYKLAYDKQKAWCKKYHMTEKGKEKRRKAQRKYYNKKKLEKLNSAPIINAL